MICGFRIPRLRQTPSPLAKIVVMGLAALMVLGDRAAAQSRHRVRAIESIETRSPGEPILAIVSLRSQSITVYDADGWILRAPVSSGRRGHETPAGIFSVLQRNAEHYSNLYDDAYMPHMQRLTWSGIALHGGVLPGYPASHGCIRLPFDFAARLFDATKLGMRVIVAPEDVAPVEIAHPILSKMTPVYDWAAVRFAEAEAATRDATQARLAAVKAYQEAGRARMPVRVAENLKRRAEADLAVAEAALLTANSAEERQRIEETKTRALERIAEFQVRWVAANAKLQPKLDAIAPARDAATAAEAARVAAVQVANGVAPVSLFISRANKRLYVRRAFRPVLESPVIILDDERKIGTHIYTVVTGNADRVFRWNAISLDSGTSLRGLHGVAHRGGYPQERSTDSDGAKEVLDRIMIPKEVTDSIAEIISPQSSLIISDEALSSETSKSTDFIVILSNELQGSLKVRRRGSGSAADNERARER
jgi:hypothetical protein